MTLASPWFQVSFRSSAKMLYNLIISVVFDNLHSYISILFVCHILKYTFPFLALPYNFTKTNVMVETLLKSSVALFSLYLIEIPTQHSFYLHILSLHDMYMYIYITHSHTHTHIYIYIYIYMIQYKNEKNIYI